MKKNILLIILFISSLACLGQEPTEVGSVANNTSLSIVNANLKRYALPNSDNFISLKIKNEGTTVINSLNVNWTDGLNTHNATVKTSIAPSQTKTIQHPIPVNFSDIVDKTITTTLSEVNASPNFRSTSNSVSTKFNTLTKKGTKAVLVEEGTGTWCGWCPRGAVALEELTKKYPKTFIGVAVHVRDTMKDKNYRESSGFRRYPSIHIDRTLMHQKFENTEGVEKFYKQRIDEETPADLSAEITKSGNDISIKAQAEFYTDIASAQLRLGVVVIENGVTGASKHFNQQNMYSGGDYGPMGGYEDKPNPVPAKDMVYDHVGRALLGTYRGQKGSVPTTIKAGDKVDYTFNYSIPKEFDIKNMHVIVTLSSEENRGELINAKEVAIKDDLSTTKNTFMSAVKMYPNPANDVLNINFEAENTDYDITITDLLGKIVLEKHYTKLSGKQAFSIPMTALSKGTYLVTLSNSNASNSKMIIVD